MDTKERKTTSYRLGDEARRLIEKVANIEGRNQSSVIEDLVLTTLPARLQARQDLEAAAREVV